MNYFNIIIVVVIIITTYIKSITYAIEILIAEDIRVSIT